MKKREMIAKANKRRVAMLKMRSKGATLDEIAEAFSRGLEKRLSRQRVHQLLKDVPKDS